MAKAKYFHVKHAQSGAQHLVRAGKPAEAIAAVAGNAGAVVAAEADAISQHFADGGQLHQDSREAGDGKLFFVPAGESSALIRAKNANEAFAKVNGAGVYDVTLTTTEQLVDLLTQGLRPVDYVAPVKSAKGGSAPTSNANDASSGATNDGASQQVGQTGDVQNGEGSTATTAAADAEAANDGASSDSAAA